MREPCYKQYFTPTFWQLAKAEYTPERTEREVAYLRNVLQPLLKGGVRAGGRVLDLGCGMGRHAVALAAAGANIVGLDMSEDAASASMSLAEAQGVRMQVLVGDAFDEDSWDFAQAFDAIVCIQSTGWGSEAQQRRLLRNCRRHLADGGVFILDHSNVFQILRHFVGQASLDHDGVSYRFDRTFDVLTERCKGSLTATGGGASPAYMPHDFQLYSTHTLLRELRHAGFQVNQVDADFESGRPVTSDTRYVQIISAPAPVAPRSLAVRSHQSASQITDRESPLNLMWAPDEVDWLDPTPGAIWSDVLHAAARDGANSIRRYPLDDPYGAHRSREVIERFFNTVLPAGAITFGAGITGLLRQLDTLADGGVVLTPPGTHVDYSVWAGQAGAQIERLAGATSLLTAVDALSPALVHLDRPSVSGEILSLERIGALCRALRQSGGLLMIDEAYHAYYAGMDSAVSLVPQHPNLIVLRSLSKAYCCGGLRVAFAVAGESAAIRVREQVAPLQVSELAFQMALALMEAGDLFESLRDRVRQTKPHVLHALPVDPALIVAGAPDLPWALIKDADGSLHSDLKGIGILTRQIDDGLRLSIPLSDDRLSQFNQHIQRLSAHATG